MKFIKKAFALLSFVFCSIVILNSCSNFKIVDRSNDYDNEAIDTLHNFINESIKKYEDKPLLDIAEIDIINVNFSNEKIKFGGTPSEEEIVYDGCYTIAYKITSNLYDYGINILSYPECNLEKRVKNLKSIHSINIYYSYNDKKEMEYAPVTLSFLYDIYFKVYEQNKSKIGEWEI